MGDFQRDEDQLRQKISSKTSVSTFLAGFNFTALTLVLTLLGNKKDLTGNSLNLLTFRVETQSLLEISTVLFFLATTLFVASVYSYDQLLMPRQFGLKNVSKLRGLMFRFIHTKGLPQYDTHNLEVYVCMLSVWYTMFIPATFFSTVGIIVLVYTVVQFKAFASTLGITFIVLVYYFVLKPRFAAD